MSVYLVPASAPASNIPSSLRDVTFHCGHHTCVTEINNERPLAKSHFGMRNKCSLELQGVFLQLFKRIKLGLRWHHFHLS